MRVSRVSVRGAAVALAGLYASAACAAPTSNPFVSLDLPVPLQVLFVIVGLVLLLGLVFAAWRQLLAFVVFAAVAYGFYGPLNFTFWSSVLLAWVSLAVPLVVGNYLLNQRPRGRAR